MLTLVKIKNLFVESSNPTLKKLTFNFKGIKKVGYSICSSNSIEQIVIEPTFNKGSFKWIVYGNFTFEKMGGSFHAKNINEVFNKLK